MVKTEGLYLFATGKLEEVFKPKRVTFASRLVQSSSPGCTKRKVQQKLQRDGKQQPANARSSQGSPSLLQKQYSGSHIPNSKLATPLKSQTLEIARKAEEPKQNGIIYNSKLKTPETRQSGIPSAGGIKSTQNKSPQSQSNYCSTLPRLSQKSSDASSSDTSSSDSGSCRSTPMSGGDSPLYGASKSNISPSNIGIPQPKINTALPAKSGIPGRTLSSADNKRSLDSLRMSHENTSESLKQRKASSSSIPCSRNKQPYENLQLSRENTSESLRQRKDSNCSKSSRRSSVESCSSDTTDIVKPVKERSSLTTKYRSKSQNNVDERITLKLKIPGTGIPSTNSKQSQSAHSVDSEAKIKPPSGIAKPSSVAKPSLIGKPSSIARPSSSIKPPAELVEDTVRKTPYAEHNENGSTSEEADKPTALSPAIQKKIKSSYGLPRRASDSTTVLSKYKSKLTFHKECSDLTNFEHEPSPEEIEASQHNEREGLRHPTVGKLPRAFENNSNIVRDKPLNHSSVLHPPLRFTSSNESKQSISLIPENEKSVVTEEQLEDYVLKNQDDSVSAAVLKIDVVESGHGTIRKVNKELDELNLYLNEQEKEFLDESESMKFSASDKNNELCLYKLDIPSPPGEEENISLDSVSYPYNNAKLTHQNVELIIADRIELSKAVDNSSMSNRPSTCYAEPEDSIKCKTNSNLGYMEPVDSVNKIQELDLKNGCKNSHSQKNNLSENGDNSCSSLPHIPGEFNRSKLSRKSSQTENKNFYECNGNRIDSTTPVSSPFKRIQPKIIVPPPKLNSLSTEGGLAPVPKEYIRTPSFDGEELQVSHYYSEIDNIRRKAREQAIKAWKKKQSNSDDDTIKESCGDLEIETRERLDMDVFYPSEEVEGEEIDTSEKFESRTSNRRASEGNVGAVNDNKMYHLETMTLDRDKKKKSKIKKFFKKLASKKEDKIELEHCSDHDRLPSTDGLRVSTNSSSNLRSRRQSDGSCSSDQPYSNHRSNSIGSSSSGSKKSAIKSNDDDWKKHVEIAVQNSRTEVEQNRFSSHSTDSALSSESLSSSQRSNTSHMDMPYDHNTPRASSSLRRTPLRHSIDSVNKVLQVHRQTIEKISYEASRLHCDCEPLRDLDWEDFDRKEKMIQLGLNSYMVVPVTTSQDSSDRSNYTAWLRLDQKHTATQTSEFPHINYQKSTLHRNCLHICHTIEQTYAAPCQDGIPKSIQIDCVYISPQTPKMTLSKYTSLTLEKHARYPEIYERETALILLQVVKGIQHLYRNGIFISSLEADNVFILNNGEPSVVLSPKRERNKCPAVVLAVLPGLGNCFPKTEEGTITSLCYQLAFLLYELLHSPYHDELGDAIDMSMLLATLPDLTIKSIYSRYLQHIVTLLLGSASHGNKSFEDLRLILEVILFGPTDISDHAEDEAVYLINKWHKIRCVDMVTHILKEAPLIMLCVSGTNGKDDERVKTVDQEILLECEFLSDITSADIYRISKMLNR